MTNQEPKKENITIPFKIAEESEQIYMTGAFGGFTPYDFRIILYNETLGPKGEIVDEGSLIRESKYQLIMSPLTAKELLLWLQKNIKAYEDQVGEIEVPNSGESDI